MVKNNNNNTSDILAIFTKSQGVRQGKAQAKMGIKFVPSGKLYVNLDGVAKDDILNIVYAKNCVIFRLATSDELELSKNDKAIASHLYKVSGNRHAVALPAYARDLLNITTTLDIPSDNIECETIDDMLYYRVVVK